MSAPRVAVVTGSSSGIGRATARRLAQAGFSVFLVAEGTEEALAAAAGECRSLGAEAAFAVHDLGDEGAATTMVAEAAARFGRIDVLVNNAAVRIRHPFGEYTAAEFDRAIAVNLKAPFLASQAAVPIMRGQGGGRIIHVASQLGTVAYVDSALYGLTKAALIYLARAMAFELARDGIVVNTVSPGPIATDYNKARMEADPGFSARRVAYIPAGRWGRPEEVAEAIVFLATAEGGFIQGHDLVIDGGYISH